MMEIDHAFCNNCKRRGDDLSIEEFDRTRLAGKQSKSYWGVGKLPRGQQTVLLCSRCQRYLLENSSDPCDYWYAMVYIFLAHTTSNDVINVSIAERWKVIPDSWRPWWREEFEGKLGIEECESAFVDVTAELSKAEAAIESLKWKKLAPIMDKHFAYPEVRCPWGCSEFLTRTNKVPLKEFLWYYTNYEMDCCKPAAGTHWTDTISPTYPSKCLILEKFECTPSIAITEDGPMILCCRDHSERSTKAYIHVPESPTGSIYTPNSNSVAPVTLRSRTNRSFKPNVFSDTFKVQKQQGGFGGLDTGYATFANMAAGKSDSLACIRDSLGIQGRPDIRAQICDRCNDEDSSAYLTKASIDHILQFAESKFPEPTELKECQSSTYVSCENAVRLQEKIYGDASQTIKCYHGDSGDFTVKLFQAPWPSHLVPVHRCDGYGQRFQRVLDTDFGIWVLLCVTGRVNDLWEALSESVVDNRSWIGHWLLYSSIKLGLPGRRKSQSSTFTLKNREEMLEEIEIACGGVGLEQAFEDIEVAEALFSDCPRIKVVEGYLSELEYTDGEMHSWDAVVCIKPDSRTIGDTEQNFFELRCLVSAPTDSPRNKWAFYARHSGQGFWVQKGTRSPSKYSFSILEDEMAWEHARVAVFCPRIKRTSGDLQRRYLNVLGGQNHVYCNYHKCPLIINYYDRKNDSRHLCICESCETFGRDAVTTNGGASGICGKYGEYICPRFSCCKTAICRQHLDLSKNACANDPGRVISISEGHAPHISRDGDHDDGAVIVNPGFDSTIVPPEALGPTTAHEVAQDIIDDDESDLFDVGSDDGDEETVSLESDKDKASDDGESSVGSVVLHDQEDELISDGAAFIDEDAEMENQRFGGTAYGESFHEETTGADHFNTQDIPVTATGTDQREIEVENDTADKIPLCVLFNQLGHLLTRTGHKIRMSKKHKHLCQRLVSTNSSRVVPLVYAEAQLFGDIFWQSLPDGTVPGAMPVALWTDKQTLDKLGIASLREHAKQRMTNPALLTSVDPRYHFMLLDQLSNLGANGKHTRLVLQRGFADHQGKDGVSFREKGDSAEIYGETCENRANVHKLCELVRENKPHYFFTQTCNQKTCRGLRVLREWVESDEAMIHLHLKYGLDFPEASRYMRESAATYASRSWNEVAELWMRYIIHSSEQPLGRMRYGWLRKEFQDLEGNLFHIHSILCTYYDINNPAELAIVLNNIRGCMKELISHMEYENLKGMGFISSVEHLYEILDMAKRFLPHKCHQRCVFPYTTKDGETIYVCKAKDYYFQSPTPHAHTLQVVNIPRTPEAKAIYNRLGMMDGDVVLDDCLKGETHCPISSTEDPKFSPTNPTLFSGFPSSQNLQYTTGHTTSSYVTKYATKVDDVARAIVKPPGRYTNSAAKVVIEELHNTKITSNKIRAEQTLKKDTSYGRLITHTECISVLLGHDLVLSTVEFKHYSTSPREYRPALIKRSNGQPRASELHDYVANLAAVGQEVRRKKGFNEHRLFSSDQLTVIFDERFSNLTSDAITEFSIRPPELRFVNIVRLYVRWFEKKPIKFKKNDIETIRRELSKRLNVELSRSQWINGLNAQIVMRRGAIYEILEYAEACDVSLFGLQDQKTKMLELFKQLLKYHEQFDRGVSMEDEVREVGTRSVRESTNQSSREQFNKLESNFLVSDKSTFLPVTWTTPVFPKNRGRFLVYILLMFGRFETEYGLMSTGNMKDAYELAGLYDSDNPEQSIDELLRRYAQECLAAQPGSSYIKDRNLQFSEAAFFDCLLGREESEALMGTPCVLQSAMKEKTTVKVNEEKRKLLKSFIDALYTDLEKSGFSTNELPDRQQIEAMHLQDTPLRETSLGQESAGDVPYKFPPEYKRDREGQQRQSRESYEEQREVLNLSMRTINRFLAGYTHKNLVICGGPGNGKTTVCEEICLYALSKGLKGIATSIVADRSKALGGMHIHLLCALYGNDRANVSPGQAAEIAVSAMQRKPELLHFWRELQFIYIDELGAVSSEMFATMDIIARHAKGSSRFLGGILTICSTDVFQLLPVDGTALMLSMNMMTEFAFVELKQSVRAAQDPLLQRLCLMTRTDKWTRELRDEFKGIIKKNCSFLESFDDPNTPEDGIYVFSRKAPCQKIENILIDRMRTEGKIELVLSRSHDAESTRAGNWKEASVPVSQALSSKLKLKRELYLFEKGRYEFTYNRHGHFQQGQLALLLSVNKQNVEDRKSIEFYKGPPGCKEFPPMQDINRQYLLSCGWKPVMVPFETSKPTRIRGRLVGRRTQYGVRLRIASTIHASQGATFGKLITAVTNISAHGDMNFSLWEAAQVVVLTSRTRMCKDLYFVGDPDEVVEHLLSVLELTSQKLSFIKSMTHRLCSRDDGSTVIDRPPIFRPCDFVLDRIPGVYLLVSTKCYGYMYIGETSNLRKRLDDHNSGRGSNFTNNQRLRPWALFGYVHGFTSEDNRRMFENDWKRRALLLRNRTNTFSPMGMLSIAQDKVAEKNRNRMIEDHLVVQRCGSYEVRFGASSTVVETT